MPRVFAAALAAFSLASCAAPEDQGAASTPSAEPKTPVGINAAYVSPELDVDDLAEGFSAESREVFAVRGAVIRALGVEPGQSVADIGTGTGIYVPAFAEAVGRDGTVYAIDISRLLVDYVRRMAAAEGYGQVEAILGEAASTTLPQGSVDLAFTSDVYHHFEAPMAMNEHLFGAIRPGGRFAVLDFRRGPDAADWVKRHVRADMGEVIAEVTQAGFEFEGELAVPGLRENYLIVFRRPG